MNKFARAIGVSVLAASLMVGCSQNENTDTQANTNEEEATEQVESEHPYPTDASEMGEGKIVVSTPSGTSEEEELPVLIVDEDTILDSVGLDLENFDGSKETFVYVNEVYVQSEQVGELAQTSVELVEDLLEPGTYTVSAIQFEDDDPANEVTQLTKAQFEIK